MSDHARVGLTLTLVGAILSVVGYAAYDAYKAAPSLAYVRWEKYPNCTDIIVQSESSRAFPVLGYETFIKKVLKDPPPKPAPSPPAPPSRRHTKPDKRSKDFKKLSKGNLEYLEEIPADPVYIHPKPKDVGKWVKQQYKAIAIDAGQLQRIALYMIDADCAGAEYLVDVRIFYGDQKDRRSFTVQDVPINVVAQAVEQKR